MPIEYAIIVKSKTRLETLIERFNTKAQAKFYIESLGANYQEYELEHNTFYRALETLQSKLTKLIKNKIIERSFLPSFLFDEKHVIIVIGQDGLVANTAKYAKNCPIIAVNPDPSRFDGPLLPFNVNNFTEAVTKTLQTKHTSRKVHFAQATLNDGQRLLAFNDLFIGAATHVSARYKIQFNSGNEVHSSSGIIVSTSVGNTGWMSSIFNMAQGIAQLSSASASFVQPTLNDNQLIFAVREPFLSKTTSASINCGLIQENNQLVLESLMPANGVIFSDGIESDFIRFNSGAIATIGLAKEKVNLVVN